MLGLLGMIETMKKKSFKAPNISENSVCLELRVSLCYDVSILTCSWSRMITQFHICVSGLF